ncbi:septum formation initiator family protein [Paenibacillus sepulcri]|uniref:Septum formation initiator family protein n=1 Tax=Paenibacillus sepulcri TaxID=359917 RepID=A0ABS7C860_9BACL|nr:septum formation initiator family protein [Paenibacillus sepulcri]
MMTATGSTPTPSYAGTKRRLKLWFIVIALFLGWASYTFISQLERQGQSELKLAETKQMIDTANTQINDLKQEVAKLNDKEYIGQLATKEQGMVKKGEQQIQVIED